MLILLGGPPRCGKTRLAERRNRWHRELDAATLATVPQWIESWSSLVEDECVRVELPYVELGVDFAAGTEAARRLLLGGNEHGEGVHA